MFKGLALCLFMLGGSAVHAQDIAFGEVSFLPGWTEPGGSMIAAIRIDLNPGWKTYWRVPGAAGIPPVFNWVGSQNLKHADVLFPLPEVSIVAGLQSIGYRGTVVFPLRITPDETGQPIGISLDFSFGVCDQICIPAQQKFVVTLDPAAEANTTLIRKVLAQGPVAARDAGVISAHCDLAPDGRDFVLQARIELADPPAQVPVAVFEPGAADLWADAATTRIDGNILIASAPLQFYGQNGVVLDRSNIRLTLIGEDQAIDIQGCPADQRG